MSNEKKTDEAVSHEGKEVTHEEAQKHAEETAKKQQEVAHEGDAKPETKPDNHKAGHKK